MDAYESLKTEMIIFAHFYDSSEAKVEGETSS
jgi:hypothetical protein